MEFIAFLVAAGAVIGLLLRVRIVALEEQVAAARDRAVTESQLRELTPRVWELERHVPAAPASPAEEPPEEAPVTKARPCPRLNRQHHRWPIGCAGCLAIRSGSRSW